MAPPAADEGNRDGGCLSCLPCLVHNKKPPGSATSARGSQGPSATANVAKQTDGHSSASQKDLSSSILVTAEAGGTAPPSHDTALPPRAPDGTPAPSPPAPPSQTHLPTTTPTGASSQPAVPAEAPLPPQPTPAQFSGATGDALGTTGPAAAAAAPATWLPEALPHAAVGVDELRTLAATSHGSTAYYSAGGWSQFSEDAPELHSPTRGHVPATAAVAYPADTDGRPAHGRGAEGVGSCAEAAGAQLESQGAGEPSGGAGAWTGAGTGAEGAGARGRLAHSPTPSPHLMSAHAQLAGGHGPGHVAGHDTQRQDRSPLAAVDEDAGLELGKEQLGDGVVRQGGVEAVIGAAKGQVGEGYRAVMPVAEGLEASDGVHGAGSGGRSRGVSETAVAPPAVPAASTTTFPLSAAASGAAAAAAAGVAVECSELVKETPGPAGAAQATTTAAVVVVKPQPALPAVDGASSADTADGAGGVESLEELVSRVCELYLVQARPHQAHQLLLQHCRERGTDQAALGAALRAKGLPDVEGLGKVVEHLAEGLADLQRGEGWQLVQDGGAGGLRLQYRHVAGTSVHGFRADCTLEAPTTHLIALAREVDLQPTWNKYCTSGYILRTLGPADATAYLSMWVPWPFHDVGMLLDAAGAVMLQEDGCFAVAMCSPPGWGPRVGAEAKAAAAGSARGRGSSKGSAGGGSPRGEAASPTPHPEQEPLHGPPPALPPGTEKHGRVRVLAPSVVKFVPEPPARPGGPPRTRMHMQMYVDPGIKHVPSFIITFVLKVMSPFIFSTVKKLLATTFAKEGSPMPQRIRQRPELYALVEREGAAFLEQRQQRKQEEQ